MYSLWEESGLIMEVAVKRAGLTLRGILEKSKDANGRLAILFHGFGGDIDDRPGSIFQTISDKLLQKGISILRFDFNGHGKSDGDFSEMTPFNEIEDGMAIINYARNLDFVTEIYLIGHSQGAVIAGMLAGYYEDVVSKLILLAPAASLKTDAQMGKCMRATYDTNHIPEKVDVDGVHIVGGHYFRIAKYLPLYEVTSQFRKPVLIVHGKKDAVISMTGVLQYRECLANCLLKLYDGLDHGLAGENQSDMYYDILEFLN